MGIFCFAKLALALGHPEPRVSFQSWQVVLLNKLCKWLVFNCWSLFLFPALAGGLSPLGGTADALAGFPGGFV
jgi:hypothetical protein